MNWIEISDLVGLARTGPGSHHGPHDHQLPYLPTTDYELRTAMNIYRPPVQRDACDLHLEDDAAESENLSHDRQLVEHRLIFRIPSPRVITRIFLGEMAQLRQVSILVRRRPYVIYV